MRSPFMHNENTLIGGGLGSVALSSPVPESEGPGAPSSWFEEVTGTEATRPWFGNLTGTAATRPSA
jgi:hypothetical protein